MTDKANKKPPTPAEDPPAELFHRTPEQKQRDRELADLEVEREREKAEAEGGVAFQRRRLPDNRSTEEVLASVIATVRRRDEERRALPCIRAMFPAGAPDGADAFLAALAASGTRLQMGKAACDAARAQRGCPMNTATDFCAQLLVPEVRSRTVRYLIDGRVPDDERDRIMAALDGQALQPHDTLKIARAVLERARLTVKLDEADHVDPRTGTPISSRELVLTGEERLIVFGGNNGRGKTLAGCYAIGRAGGVRVTDYELEDPRAAGLDLAEIVAHRGIVVIDQFGRGKVDKKRSVILNNERIVSDRYERDLQTWIVGNFDHATFAARADRVTVDRVAGRGALVLFYGESLR